MRKIVIFCIPIAFRDGKPHPETTKSLEASLPLVEQAGWEHGLLHTNGNPYISAARAEMTRTALDHIVSKRKGEKEDRKEAIFYIDHDVSWEPEDLLKVLEADGDVVAGTYRVKEEGPENYMGSWYTGPEGTPIGKVCGDQIVLKAKVVPAGFLRVTTDAIDSFMEQYPELRYGPWYHLSADLFNHGARNRLWWGEDYAFADRYNQKCGQVWLVPNVSVTHWEGNRPYPGNLHEYLMKQPGGINDPVKELVNVG